MAKSARTAIESHLATLIIGHHTARRLAVWRAQNFALWIEMYGETVTDKVNKICSAHWREKKLHGVPFHPLLVSLFRTANTGESK